jgi:uncharacterized protein YjiK
MFMVLLFALLESIGISSCKRSEPTSNLVIVPETSSLQLLRVHSLTVTEPSGLAYSQVQQALYMISDNSPAVYRIDTLGRVLSSISVDAQDIEGVALSANAETLYVVEETPSLVSKFLMNGTKVSSFPVTVRTLPNHSLEGITVDNQGHLYVLNEQSPMMMLGFSGRTEILRMTLNYSTDISDICYDSAGDCFWIVSDESQKVFRISRTGVLQGQWSMSVRQGEGIALIGNCLYIVSDVEGKLYVFVRPS